MINFAVDVVGTTVTCDKVSCDGCEPSNLISTNFILRRKGFMTEPFIKPPVNITFTFPCHINIHQVTLDPSVGQHQSRQLEIFAAAKPISKAMRSGTNPHKSHSNSSPSRPEAPPFFYSLAKLSVSNNAQICFHNPNSNAHLQCGNSNVPLPDQFENKTILRNFRKELLTACSHLCVRITQTSSGSNACLRNISIWGVPSHSLSGDIRTQIQTRYDSLSYPSATSSLSSSASSKSQSDVTKTESNSPLGTSSSDFERDFKIPEDFIDPITCEVMAIPMLLPCGKNVDMGTLDRFSTSEASFGRRPRDPFTGVEFTDSCRPLPNAVLKSRIDQFLLKHSQEAAVATVARTVGTGKLSETKKRKGETSRSVLHSAVSEKDKPPGQEEKQKSDLNMKRGYSALCTSNACPTKKIKTESPAVSDRGPQQHSVQTSSSERVNEVSISGESVNQQQTHESRLKDSLDSALQAMLGHLASSSGAPHVSSKPATDCSTCSLCEKLLTVSCVYYRTPCSHCVCRDCVTQTSAKTIQCPVCNQTYTKTDIIRAHHNV